MTKKPTPATNQARIITIMETALLDRRSLLNKLIDPRRDYDAECGYPDTIDAAMFRATYDRQGLGARIVRVLPQESWSQDPELYETEDPSETPFENAFQKLLKEQNLWHNLQRIDEVSGIGRFGVLFLGFSDNQPDLAQPVAGVTDQPLVFEGPADDPKAPPVDAPEAKPAPLAPAVKRKPLRLLYTRCFDESVVTVATREKNVSSPRYGKPVTYNIRFTEEGSGSTAASTEDSKVVHWTRVIHVADNRQLSEVYGTPRMQEVFNRILDAKKVLSGAGEMFWKGAFPGHSFEVQPGVQAADLDTEGLKEQFEDYQNGLQRFLALVGVTVKSLAPQIADPTAHYQAILTEIAIAMAMPSRILQGSERGELASSQDQKAWNTRVARRNEKYVTPLIIREFVDRLIAAGVLPMPAEYTVFWPDLNAATDDEKAKISLTKTQALVAYVSGHGDQLIPPREFLMHIMGFDQETTDAMMEASAEYQLTSEGPLDPNVALAQDAQDQAAAQAESDAALAQKESMALNAAAAKVESDRLLDRVATLERAPKIEFTLKDERVLNLPKNEINLPAVAPPVVENNITLPQQPPVVVPAPQVTNAITVQPATVLPAPPAERIVVPAAVVNVTVPEATAPVVQAHINVQPAAVVLPESKPKNFRINRDDKNNITGASST